MKYILSILLIASSIICYSQETNNEEISMEIFFWTQDHRERVDQDFPENNYMSHAAAMVSFKDSLMSIQGDFSGHKPKHWLYLGDAKNNTINDNGNIFIQTIFPAIDPVEMEVVMVSLIQGPFQFPEEFGFPDDLVKFELTILYHKKRYRFLGISN